MAGKNHASPLLNEANAEFIQSGVSIIASSRTVKNVPVIGRAVGCHVSTDRRTIRLLFPRVSTSQFLEGIRSSRQIAVVFGRPTTHQTIQLKGADAAVVSLKKSEVRIAENYVDAIVAEVSLLGVDDAHAHAIVWFEANGLTAVEFTPREAYVQTPGPRAGEPLLTRGDAHTR